MGYVFTRRLSLKLQSRLDKSFLLSTGIGAYFGAQCEKHGMLVRVAGDNIMISPPYILSPEEIDEVCSYRSAYS